MSTLYLSHDASLHHVTPPGHPERVDRIRAIEQAMAASRFDGLVREESPLAPLETALLAHPENHVARVKNASPQEGYTHVDADTMMSRGTLEAAQRAMGAAVRAVDAVMTGEHHNAFCAMRPPGHHAEAERAMGFCFFSNAAIAALHAADKHGAERVAVIDWDVHHGNGTQDIFWARPHMFYGSIHQMPLYPGSGARNETGADDAGNICNAPLAPGDARAAFEIALKDGILPAMEAHKPDLIVISAGFDAHTRDPLANIDLVEGDFAWATTLLADAADRLCGGRVVSVLEGGYDLQGLAGSTAAHVSALMAAD
ncbi:MAG: histone deacetylase family protein [Pseudomonadota bacterium]